MSNRDELQKAYEAIFLARLRDEITLDERNARIIALRDTPIAAGLSFEERDAIANKAALNAEAIFNEAEESPGGRWQ